MSEAIQNQCIEHQAYGRKYRPSQGGHAPGHLRDALIEALEFDLFEDVNWWDALNIQFYAPAKQRWWDTTAPKKRAAWLIGQLWNCTDIVPGQIASDLGLSPRRTYARLVRQLKAGVTNSEHHLEQSRSANPDHC